MLLYVSLSCEWSSCVVDCCFGWAGIYILITLGIGDPSQLSHVTLFHVKKRKKIENGFLLLILWHCYLFPNISYWIYIYIYIYIYNVYIFYIYIYIYITCYYVDFYHYNKLSHIDYNVFYVSLYNLWFILQVVRNG